MNSLPDTYPQDIPSFLVIGGQRCGSSWIHKCLHEHPQVFTADPKEVHFFNRNYDEGEQWYRAHFHPSPEHKAWGEVTPDYIAHHETPERIASLCPNARLVAILREPIERAHSIYRLQMGTKMNYASFEEAIEERPDILEHGLYAQHLENWYKHFHADQILVMLYEDLIQSESNTIAQIFAHIGVDESYRPSWIGKPCNTALMPKLRARLSSVGLDPLVKVVGRSPIGDHIRTRVKKKKLTSDPLSKIRRKTVEQLTEYYSEPNTQLRKMLGRELDGWS